MVQIMLRVRHFGAILRGAIRPLWDRDVVMPRATMARGSFVMVSMGGKIRAGPRCALAEYSKLHAETGEIVLGSEVFIGIGSIIVARQHIAIGHGTQIGEYVTIRDQDHRFGANGAVRGGGFDVAPVHIGENVWIGAKATITRGVTIGDNAVIGANAVVTRDVASNSVAVGVPAKIMRHTSSTGA